MILGIDSGIKGGLVILSPNGLIVLAEKMPIDKEKRLLSKEILELMNSVNYIVVEEQFVIAQLHKRQNPKANFTTAYNYGKLCALAEVSGVKFGVVHPNTWQSAFTFAPVGVRKTKQHHITLAKALAKHQGHLITNDGIADAYLIALNSFDRISFAKKRNIDSNFFYNLFKIP